ncbi:MAG TPA: zf-HC2 domain-containing protein [Chloroflexia bacterium]|nr:zf-HC2 domain-containing protein [Chloroflexia bacterium]
MDNRYNNSEHVVEQISAYLDGALDDAVSDEVRAHIDDCAECHAEYIEVRATRQLLRRVHTVQPPYAFTLTPEMVQRKVWLWERLLVPRNVPKLATGSVMAFGLVLLLLAWNIGGIASITSSNMQLARSGAERNVDHLNGPGLADAGTPAQPHYNTIGTPQAQPPFAAQLPTEVTADATLPLSTPAGVAELKPVQLLPTQAVPSGGAGPISATPMVPLESSPEYTLNLSLKSAYTSTAPYDGYYGVQSQQSTDGLQVLIFSIGGLLVALGAAFAVGAVVAARR